VAELVDAADSKSVARKGVLVRVRPGAPLILHHSARQAIELKKRLAPALPPGVPMPPRTNTGIGRSYRAPN
jgi:hypothetical protein